MPEARHGPIPQLLYACCLLSGTAALAYEVVWNRELLAVFGSTTYATAAVLAAFLGGLALGAALAARVADRIRAPLRVYAGVELTIAGYALFFGPLLEALAVPYGRLWERLGATPGALLSGSLVVGAPLLLVPTLALGATLPLLGAVLARERDAAGARGAGLLYGFNTLGAVAGALGAGFVLLPYLGMGGATAVAVALNLAAAALALRAARVATAKVEQGRTPTAEVTRAAPSLLALLLVVSSAAALGYEVVWTRILVLVLGSSTYAFSLTTAVYIAGLALGSLWMASRVQRLRRPGEALAHLLIGVGWTAVIGLYLVGRLPEFFLHGFSWLQGSEVLWGLRAALAALVMLPPTFLLGAVFPVAVRLAGADAGGLGRSVGRVYGWMAAGNVVGVLAAATALIPWAGLQGSIGVLAVASLAAGALALWLRPLAARTRITTLGVAAAGGLALWGLRPGWNPVVMTSGVYQDAPLYLQLAGSPEGLRRVLDAYRLVYYREGVQSVVSVVERPTLGRDRYLALAVDGKVDASTGADMSTQVLSGHLPLLVHRDPREVLVVGLASGITVGSVARHPVQSIEVVEIEPAMPAAARTFGAFNRQALSDPRVRLVLDDGRHLLAVTQRRFDVIISEPSNPWMSGPARLFTREFFELARERLAPGGVLAQWLPLYGLEPEHVRVLVRTFLTAYPHALAFQVSAGDLLLLGSEAPLRLASERFANAWLDDGIRDDLARIGVHAPAALLATWVGGERELRRIAGSGRLNTDRNGLIEFRAPHALHANTLPRNLSLLRESAERADLIAYLAFSASPSRGWPEFATTGLATLELGYPERTRMWARTAAAIGDSAGSEYLLGRLALETGEARTARARWSGALRWEEHELSLLALARLEVEQEAFRDGLRLLNRAPPGVRSPDADYLEGVARLGLSDAAGAVQALGRAGAGRGEEPLLAAYLQFVAAERLADRGLAERQRTRFDNGLRVLRRALEREERQSELNRLLADAELLAGAVLDSAELRGLQRAIRVALLDPLAAYYRGVSLLWTGRAAEARAALEQAVQALAPSDPGSMSHFFLGVTYLELERRAAAEPHLRGFLDARGGQPADWAVQEARRLASVPTTAAEVAARHPHDGRSGD